MPKISLKIREQFPILKKKMHGKPLVYLDNAATTQKPQRVINAEKDFYESMNANIHRGVYELSEKATAQYEVAHEKVASFIGAKSFEEIVFTKNTTEAINLVASSLSKEMFRGKKKILVTAMEHHSNLLPWQRLARERGLSLEFVELTKDGKLDLIDLKNKLNKQVAILAVTHVSNVLGTVNPIDKIIKLAHKVNALVLVDAAQSIARLPINVKKSKIDFLVFSGHKMYGPLGVGVLYGKRELLEKMNPFMLGGDMVTAVTRKLSSWNSLPWKFEAGTPNVAGGVAMGTTIDFVKNVGLPSVWQHEQELISHVLPKLLEIEGVVVLGPQVAQERAGVISFIVDGVHSHDLVTLLGAEGIAARAGHHCAQPLLTTLGIKECARISFSVTTTIEELDRFIAVLRESVKILKR